MLKGSCVVSFARYLDMNPGTSINSEEVASSIFLFEDCEWEFRLSLQPKLYVYSMFGGNNINQKMKRFD
jgi:hypothetical protein